MVVVSYNYEYFDYFLLDYDNFEVLDLYLIFYSCTLYVNVWHTKFTHVTRVTFETRKVLQNILPRSSNAPCILVCDEGIIPLTDANLRHPV